MAIMPNLTALGSAIAELARYANHDSQCSWKWSMTQPRAECNCGFDDAISAISNLQDDLTREASAINTCKHDRFVTVNQSGNLLQCDDCTEVFDAPTANRSQLIASGKVDALEDTQQYSDEYGRLHQAVTDPRPC